MNYEPQEMPRPLFLLLVLLSVLFPLAATAQPIPLLDCAIYKAKIKQWKEEELRRDRLAEYIALQAVDDAQANVLTHLGYTQKQVKEMKGWQMGGTLSTAYFFKGGERIPRKTSPYQAAIEKGLLGQENQAVAFCSGLGIQVNAFAP